MMTVFGRMAKPVARVGMAAILASILLVGITGSAGAQAGPTPPALVECLTPSECINGRTVDLWDLKRLRAERLSAAPHRLGFER